MRLLEATQVELRQATDAVHAVPALYCFHHAGGSAASFGGWRLNWPATSTLRCVELPGRAGSGELNGIRTVDELIPTLLPSVLAETRHGPYAFYGHSLGALVAFKLALALRSRGAPMPMFLAVSARRAPSSPLRCRPLWNLDEDALVDSLRRLGGVSEPLLRSAKWRAMFLPVMRADLRLSDEYRQATSQPLELPVLAFRGLDDPIVSHQELAEWRWTSNGPFQQTELPGAHFFSPEGTTALRRRLQTALEAMASWWGVLQHEPVLT